jgi:hypothetical protein
MRLHSDPSIVELVASIIAIMTIIATIYAAVFNNSEQAGVALVGLTGAVSSYFLTPKSYDNAIKNPKPGVAGSPSPIDPAPKA